ncbi:MAG: asparagine synthase (glutamine-hydrolyzing) [Gammaproteobacteria bacterium]|nr:asparagine synthase (glutamine-hydrolyzing) [Gammaproteobacteria bacterium]
MTSPDGRFRIVFNGEVYNFPELRNQLIQKGEYFKSDSDTEVVLRLISIYGLDAINKLNGMFAFALHDKKKNQVTLVRDRFGVKPLYAHVTPCGVLFASEMKALIPIISHLDARWELNREAIFEYLMFRYTAGSKTLLSSVKRVEPGQWTTYTCDGGEYCKKYYNISNINSLEERQNSETVSDQIERVHDALVRSVKRRLISDAPLGIALSGGIDSSLITAIARTVHSGSINTYSITLPGFEDESQEQKFVADHLNTTHHSVALDAKTFPRHLLDCIWSNDEPLFDPQAIPLNLLSRRASEKVKVLIGGEGGDEVFAGYEFPKHLCYYRDGRKLHALAHRYVRARDVNSLLKNIPRDLSFREKLILESDFKGVENYIIYLIYTFLQPLYNRTDKMSMAASVEFRDPFLDHEVVESSLSISSKLKVSGDLTKVVLKKISERYFPKKQIYRPKVGFPIPLNAWLRDRKYFGQYIDILREARFLDRDFIDRRNVTKMLDDFYKGNDTFYYSIGGRIWILLNLELFIRMMIEDKASLAA